MIKSKVPKDVKKYKTKVFWRFTSRELIFCCVIVVSNILSYLYIIRPQHNIGPDVIFLIYFIMDTILAGFGWGNLMGLDPEVVIKSFLVNFFFSPMEKKHRHSEFKPITVKYTKKELKESKKRIKNAYKTGTLKPPIKYEAER